MESEEDFCFCEKFHYHANVKWHIPKRLESRRYLFNKSSGWGQVLIRDIFEGTAGRKCASVKNSTLSRLLAKTFSDIRFLFWGSYFTTLQIIDN